jgi:hypothetical protein
VHAACIRALGISITAGWADRFNVARCKGVFLPPLILGAASWHLQKIHEKSRNLGLEEREISQIFIKVTGVVHFGMLNTALTLED